MNVSVTFKVEDEVLVAHCPAIVSRYKCPAFKSINYAPCEVIRASNTHYFIKSKKGRYTRYVVFEHRLLRYKSCPDHLQ